MMRPAESTTEIKSTIPAHAPAEENRPVEWTLILIGGAVGATAVWIGLLSWLTMSAVARLFFA
jgi:hypothetical protein